MRMIIRPMNDPRRLTLLWWTFLSVNTESSKSADDRCNGGKCHLFLFDFVCNINIYHLQMILMFSYTRINNGNTRHLRTSESSVKKCHWNRVPSRRALPSFDSIYRLNNSFLAFNNDSYFHNCRCNMLWSGDCINLYIIIVVSIVLNITLLFH